MLFNSLEFGIFLPLVFGIYWLIGGERRSAQNWMLIAASYFFYGWWDWRFLSLILISSLVDFGVGQLLGKTDNSHRRKLLLATSLIVNLGFLGFFKYFNFFVDNFREAFSLFGYAINARTIDVLLPVGISFYTFQTLSYTIDVFRRKLEPTSDFAAFMAYVSFFPQLVAGPIERAKSLLVQFYVPRKFDYNQARDGLRQILWGLFKKVVVADTCAIYANEIFASHESYSSLLLLVGAIYFTFQIYGDFSGYSDIAIGTAKLFGFNLMRNFAFPYFSRDIAEFWRRWHISLSTWFRDYVYFPLGGSRGSKLTTIRNVMIIFLVSGFWHGANWTFIFWGALNAFYFLPLLLLNINRSNLGIAAENQFLPSLKEIFQMGLTFFLTVFAWIFFRAENLSHAFSYLNSMTEFSIYPLMLNKCKFLLNIGVLVVWEWIMRHKMHGLDFDKVPVFARWILYLILVWAVLYYFGEEQEFIYFQF